eukprot:scaffold22815_cov61-Cyclotella_meneghiniana.AAC.2
MVSILPGEAELDNAPIVIDDGAAASLAGQLKTISHRDKSWACVRHEHEHGRRLSIREKRLHRAGHDEGTIHYETKHYQPKRYGHKVKDTNEHKDNVQKAYADQVKRINEMETPHFKPEHSKWKSHNHKVHNNKNIFHVDNKPYTKHTKNGINQKCEMYSCINKNGTFIETDSPDSLGYAGKFVHRDKTVTKERMIKPGGKNWASGCVISRKYKFIYIHVLKSGGTATKEFIRNSLCGEDDKDCHKVNYYVVGTDSCVKAITEHADYFTFSFVRNPFSRIFSMYSMMDGFPLHPNMKGHVTESLPFKDFVPMSIEERRKHAKMHKSHYYNQTDFIFSKGGCPVFDFLGRVEYFDQDMRTILEHLNAKEMLDYLDKKGGVEPSNTWGSTKKKSIGGDLRKEYTSKEVSRVAADYSPDFSLLGYDKDEVPST